MTDSIVPNIPVYPPQGIQAELSLIYLYNPNVNLSHVTTDGTLVGTGLPDSPLGVKIPIPDGGENGQVFSKAPNGYMWVTLDYYTTSQIDTIVSNLQANIASTYATQTALAAHTSDTENPHNVTQAQVGLGNVDNTSDLNKPISIATQNALNLKANASDVYTQQEVDEKLNLKLDISSASATYATQTELTAHTSNTSNPHNVTKTQVGLGNVDNTSDLDKPISTAMQEALNLKADASAVYTQQQTDAALALKLDISTASSTYATQTALNEHINDKSNPHNVTQTQVGLGNVDNTSDLDKPISTATSNALGLKANSSDVYTKQEIDAKLTSVYRFKGSVATYNDLPTSGNNIGDTWNVEDTGANYAWTGTDWDKLSESIDLTPYLTKESAQSTYATQASVATGLATKQNNLTTDQLNAANSGITEAKVATYDNYATQIAAKANAADLGDLATKDTVSTAEIDANAVTTAKIMDANVTKAKLAPDVADIYATNDSLTSGLAGKQDTLTPDQLNAVNSGITAESVQQYNNYSEQISSASSAAQTAQETADSATTSVNNIAAKIPESASSDNLLVDNASLQTQLAAKADNTALDSLAQTVNNATPLNGYFTNTILSVPAEPKIIITDSGITIPSGTKYYVPNGQGVFVEKTTEQDITKSIPNDGTRLLIMSPSGTSFDTPASLNCYSQATQPDRTGVYWWDTTNNSISAITGSGLRPGNSLPLAFLTVSDGVATINTIFNYVGFFGTTLFSLPGLKLAVPNGRNSDGTLNVTVGAQTSVNVYTLEAFTRTELYVGNQGSTQIVAVGSNNYTFSFEKNQLLTTTGEQRNYIKIGTVTNDGTRITGLSLKKPFAVVDINQMASAIAPLPANDGTYIPVLTITNGQPVLSWSVKS